MREGLDLSTMSYRGLLREWLRYWWVVLVFAIAAWLGITGAGQLLYTPQYTATATLVVSVKGDENTYTSLSTATQMADVIGEIFQSDVMQELVQNENGQAVQAFITCSQVEETNLLSLSATAESPRDAYTFLNLALQHYDEVSDYVFSNASLQILQEPSVPTAPSNRPPLAARRELLTALAAVFMAGVIACFYALRFTVKKSAAAGKQLDGTILGTIPFEKARRRRAKEALLIRLPIVSMQYAEACRRVATRIEHHVRRKGHTVILVTSVNENEGKSTVAANLALALADAYKKVLLIDGDLRKPAQYKVFDEKPQGPGPLAEVLRGDKTPREAARLNVKSGVYELFLYRAAASLESMLQPEKLQALIDAFKEEMDYIVIDCSPTAAGADAEVWMQVAQSAVMVVREDWSDVRVINDTADMIWQSGCELAGFVLNAFRDEPASRAYGYDYMHSYGKEERTRHG